jgi:hypothetical protein
MFAADDVSHLIEQFWFAASRRSFYPLCPDSDSAYPQLKLKPD